MGRGVLRQHYDTDALDASTLLAAIFGFLPGDDERLLKTTLAIADELLDHGFVLRYRTDETDDGLSGREGTFLICSFWLVSALSIVGESQRALDLMERLLRLPRRPWTSTPRSSTLTRGTTSATSRRRSAPRPDRGGGADHPAGTDGGNHMSDGDYDVVIIGTGAGGGTLARRLAPVGSADPVARTRRLPAALASTTGQPRPCSSTGGTLADSVVRREGQGVPPEENYFVGGATKLYGAALFRLRREDFGELHHHGGLSPAWPISYDEMEPYYTLPSGSTWCTAPAARTRPSRRRARLPVPGSAARAPDPAAVR